MKKIIITITALLFLAGCANKQIVFGKRCFDKSTGTHSWSYVWVADPPPPRSEEEGSNKFNALQINFARSLSSQNAIVSVFPFCKS